MEALLVMLEVGVLKGQIKLFTVGASVPLSHIVFAERRDHLFFTQEAHGGYAIMQYTKWKIETDEDKEILDNWVITLSMRKAR